MRAIGLSMMCAAALCASNAFADGSTGRHEMTTPAIDGLYDIDGGAMYLHCTGSGAPTVVFDSALGMGAAEWNAIAPAVARTARTCVYDRKGIGRSAPPSATPHSPRRKA
jgi:hypothetical protein